MKVLLLIIASFAAHAQIIENWACSQPSSVSNASPAIVTCPTPHGFNMQAVSNVLFTSNAQNGDVQTIDGVAYTFVTSLNNAVPNQVLLGASAGDSTWNLYHAIVDDGYQEGTLYSSATTAHPTWTANTPWQYTLLKLFYKTPGVAGVGKSITSSAPSRFNADNAIAGTGLSRMEWNVVVSGGTGVWTGIGTDVAPHFFYARYASPTTFALWASVTIPFDSSSFGSFSGQTLLFRRSDNGANLFPLGWSTQSWSVTGRPDPSTGLYKINVPGCPDPTHELECAMSRWIPETGSPSPTGFKALISGFVIASGVATISFSSPFAYTANANTNVQPGRPIYLRQITDGPTSASGTFTHTITVPNETVVGTALNRLVKYVPATNTVTKIVTDVGGVIGMCQSGCGTTGSAVIVDAGIASCVFDNAHVAGHWVSISGYDDRCHDIGTRFIGDKDNTNSWAAYIADAQQIGVVQTTGAANAADNVFINGLNRAYVVQSINGPANGSNVTQITLNIPYPNGNYNSTTALPGDDYWFSLPAFAASTYTVNTYALFGQPADYVSPGFQRMVKDISGFSSAGTNRIVPWVKWGKNLVPCGSQIAMEMGSYWAPPNFTAAQGPHMYSDLDPANYAGQWHKYSLTMMPSHKVQTGDSGFDYPNDPMFQGMPFGWNGSAHFIDRLGTFYLNFQSYFCDQRDASGQTVYIGPVSMESAVGEPEELIAGREASWSPARFTSADVTAQSPTPSGTQGYDIAFDVPKTQVVQYEWRYSTVGSLKTLGFSAGKCQDGTTTCGSADRVTSSGSTSTLRYLGATQAQASRIWWAGKPISVPIAWQSANGANPTWIGTQVALSMDAGDRVTTAGTGGAGNRTNVALSAIRDRQTWTRFDPRPAPMNVTAYSNAGGLIKVSTAGQGFEGRGGSGSHGLITGQTVQNYGAVQAGVNGQHTITVVDATSFTIDGSDYATTCPSGCSGGGIRLNLPGTLTSITSNGTASPNTVCTVNLTVPHNLETNWKVNMWGAPDSHLSNADGITPSTYPVTGTPTSTSFTFACPASTPTGSLFNTDQLGQAFTVQSWPAVAVAVTASGTYSSGGTIFSTEDLKGFAEIDLPSNPTLVTSSSIGGNSTIGGNSQIK